MKLAFSHPQLLACLSGIQSFSAVKFEEMPDEVRGVTMGELPIFFWTYVQHSNAAVVFPPDPPSLGGSAPKPPEFGALGQD